MHTGIISGRGGGEEGGAVERLGGLMVIKGVHEVCESAREGGFTGERPVCM